MLFTSFKEAMIKAFKKKTSGEARWGARFQIDDKDVEIPENLTDPPEPNTTNEHTVGTYFELQTKEGEE